MSWANLKKYVELQLGVVQHCQSLKRVIDLLANGKTAQAISRLDQAVAALGSIVKGQCVGVTMPCPRCGDEQDVKAWTQTHECSSCFKTLIWPDDETA